MGWTLKRKSNGAYVWACDFYTDLQYHNINNFAQYGQPLSPYEPGFDHEFYDKKTKFHAIEIEMPQSQVMYSGYGRKVKLDMFPVVKDFFGGKLSLPNGSYGFTELLRKGKTYPYARNITTDLYVNNIIGGIDGGEIGRGDAAYIHGSVSFLLVEDTIEFKVNNDLYSVSAEIRAENDNWDFNSANKRVQRINHWVAAIVGPYSNNLENEIAITFVGPGRRDRMEKRIMRGRGAPR